jgi:hypothetical protein
MAKNTPLVEDNMLKIWDFEANQLIPPFDISNPKEWPYWQ